MAALRDEIEAFQEMRGHLESTHMGRWVLVHDRQLIDSFETFEAAADQAVLRFGRGPFLIRQVGASTPTLPISVMYAWPNADN